VIDGGELPTGTSEIGIDIIRVDRIASVLRRHPERFERRVLTDAERSYVRGRPETMAGRWAAKEAVSKVLGLGVRGIGWQEIEVERLPTGQPSVRLHDRAAARATQLGIQHVALSISHEREYAIAIAYAVRTAGGRYLFPPQIGEDLDAMLEEIKRQPNGLTELALEARSNVFPHRYLGEKMGWEGVDKARLKAYKETGKILIR
jgi:holo-[acyl-carrier-protein] synthase